MNLIAEHYVEALSIFPGIIILNTFLLLQALGLKMFSSSGGASSSATLAQEAGRERFHLPTLFYGFVFALESEILTAFVICHHAFRPRPARRQWELGCSNAQMLGPS